MTVEAMMRMWVANCIAAIEYCGSTEDVLRYHASAWGGGKEGVHAFRSAVHDELAKQKAAR